MARVQKSRVQPLNIKTVKTAVLGAQQFVQDDKVRISRTTIAKLQYAKRWPDEYISFVGSETRLSRTPSSERFFRVMSEHPEWYAKRFIFRPLSDTTGIIVNAAKEALRIARRQANLFNVITGQYTNSFDFNIDGRRASMSELDRVQGEPVISIYNRAPYASTLEANSLYYRASIGGVLYYAANKIRSAYPELGVSYTYTQAEFIDGALHKYQVPVLTIGTRSRVVDEIVKPGSKIRRRSRRRRNARRTIERLRT